METNEDFWVQYFNGSAWQTVATFVRGATYANGTFYHANFTISSASYTFPTNAKLRFMCDASDNNDDVYIDEIQWRGMSGTAGVVVNELTKNSPLLPTQFSLSQNYPNPFNAGTNVTFTLGESGIVELTVYNVLGQTVRQLASGEYPEGTHTIQFDGTDNNGRTLASGMYFYRLTSGERAETKKMLLLK